MSNSITAIPRFLLPQLTWKATINYASPAVVRLPSSPRRHLESSQQQPSQRRSVSTTQPKLTSSKWPKVMNSVGRPSPLTQSLFSALRSSYTVNSPRTFSSSPISQKDHHFDTLKFVNRLKDEGFSEEQAQAMMRVLSDVISESIQNLTRTMVPREDAARASYTQKVDFAKLRSELLTSDNSEQGITRTSHERMANEIAKLDARLRDEINRTQASVRLDLNLEKGRIREEANAQEMKIKETEARIEQESAGLKERVEAVKFSTLQWLMGVCTGTAALILGAWRLLM